MPLPRLADGSRMQVGQSRIEHIGSFASGMIEGPFEARYEDNSGNPVNTGAVTFASSPPAITVMSPGVANNRAILRSTFALDASTLEALWIRLEGLRFSIEGGYDISLRLYAASTAGISLVHRANDGTAPAAVIRRDLPVAVDSATTFRFYGPDASLSPALRPRSIELLWHPQRKRAYMIEEGDVLIEADTSAAVLGVVRPLLMVNTKNTTPRGFTCERIAVGYEHS